MLQASATRKGRHVNGFVARHDSEASPVEGCDSASEDVVTEGEEKLRANRFLVLAVYLAGQRPP